MESNHKQIIGLIRAISGQSNVLTIPRVFVGLCKGSHRAALLLSQIIYWSDKGSEDGWFWKTRHDWRAEIGLNQHAVETALKVLPWVETKVASVGRTPKTHYRVDLERLAADVAAFLDTERNPINVTERIPINDTERKTIKPSSLKTTNQKTTIQLKGAAAPPKVEPVAPDDEAAKLDAMVEAIRRVTKVVGAWGLVKKTARDLVTAGYTAEQVDRTYTGPQSPWRKRDWRGKRGDAPTVTIIPQTIGQLNGEPGADAWATYTPPFDSPSAEPEPPPPPKTEAEQLWERALASLAGEIPRQIFHERLAPTRLEAMDPIAGTFTVVAPTPFGATWLQERLDGAIRRTLAATTGTKQPRVTYTSITRVNR